MIRIGIDVGGTFTDLVALDEDSGALTNIKVATTPRAPERGVLAALRKLLSAFATVPAVSLLSHSTTIATNALLGQEQLELPRVAFLTTHGFRDVLEIGRQNRSEVYNLFVQRPKPLVAREDRIAVRERVESTGEISVALDAQSVRDAIATLRERNISCAAIGFLHSYANDKHERAVAQAVSDALPHLHLSLSSQVDPEYREYERFSTTVVNAALIPLVQRYLRELNQRIRDMGITAPLYVMQSNGGMAEADIVARRPASIIESGPASGVIAAAALGRTLGISNVLAFDMGGTTAKAGTIFGGEAQVVSEFEAAGKTHSGRSVKGSGYPVRFPFIDLAEVSAGGGTIAWIDRGGSLRVGPLSAGAEPGPACYGNADRPTVTDANLLLGRLPDALLGGDLSLNAQRAEDAVKTLAAALPNMTPSQIAAGIVRLADAEMAKVLRIVTVERGYDARDFTLMAFGGGGPLHGCAVAEELNIRQVIVPADPGLFSARGLLFSDLRSSFVRAVLCTTGNADDDLMRRLFVQMEGEGVEALGSQNVAAHDMSFARECDLRYLGQGFELRVPWANTLAATVEAFHGKHHDVYGYDSRDDEVEIVNARLVAIGSLRAIKDAGQERQSFKRSGTPGVRSRQVWSNGEMRRTNIYSRESVRGIRSVQGPAVIEQFDSCTFVAPGWSAENHSCGTLAIRRDE
ncbi:MAG: hydantoinase/oxoprolinase family protein [Candidatus Eremiobacteraeota bacterium]|nr:hydantoinase/oxoprolinase family protein [Candidatus Eremiobacteraeota bacterium]